MATAHWLIALCQCRCSQGCLSVHYNPSENQSERWDHIQAGTINFHRSLTWITSKIGPQLWHMDLPCRNVHSDANESTDEPNQLLSPFMVLV